MVIRGSLSTTQCIFTSGFGIDLYNDSSLLGLCSKFWATSQVPGKLINEMQSRKSGNICLHDCDHLRYNFLSPILCQLFVILSVPAVGSQCGAAGETDCRTGRHSSTIHRQVVSLQMFSGDHLTNASVLHRDNGMNSSNVDQACCEVLILICSWSEGWCTCHTGYPYAFFEFWSTSFFRLYWGWSNRSFQVSTNPDQMEIDP
jgi:hypothetical protein